MHDLQDTFDSFDPPQTPADLCPIIDDANNVRETPVKDTYANLTATEHMFSLTIDSIKDSTTTSAETLEALIKENNELPDALKHIRNAKELYKINKTSHSQSNDPDRIEKHLSEVQSRSNSSFSKTNEARTADTIEETHQKLTEACTLTERALTQLMPLLTHESYEDCESTVIWDPIEDAVHAGEGISLNGYCLICGKEFEQYHDFIGVYDDDKDDSGGYAYRR